MRDKNKNCKIQTNVSNTFVYFLTLSDTLTDSWQLSSLADSIDLIGISEVPKIAITKKKRDDKD